MGRWLTAMRSIDGTPENITYFYGDDDLESTRGPRFQVNSVDERLGIADIAHSKVPKTLRGGHDLSLIRRCTCLDLDRAYCLGCWYVAGILLILLELVFKPVIKHRGSDYPQELAERLAVPASGHPQWQRCGMDSHHRSFRLQVGRLTPW